jgi:hypothetical protein
MLYAALHAAAYTAWLVGSWLAQSVDRPRFAAPFQRPPWSLGNFVHHFRGNVMNLPTAIPLLDPSGTSSVGLTTLAWGQLVTTTVPPSSLSQAPAVVVQARIPSIAGGPRGRRFHR